MVEIRDRVWGWSRLSDDFRYYLGRFTYAVFFVLALLLLAVFHYSAISFVYVLPLMPEFSISGRVFGALLIGLPTAIVDVLTFRYVRGQIREAPWIAEDLQRHEEEVRQEQLSRR
jgi:hypothetical protein